MSASGPIHPFTCHFSHSLMAGVSAPECSGPPPPKECSGAASLPLNEDGDLTDLPISKIRIAAPHGDVVTAAPAVVSPHSTAGAVLSLSKADHAGLAIIAVHVGLDPEYLLARWIRVQLACVGVFQGSVLADLCNRDPPDFQP